MNLNYSRTKNSLLNLLTSMGGQFLTILLKFITRTVLIYTLGKTYLGINGLFSDIIFMLSLTELGIDTAINFQLYKPLAEHNNKRVRVLVKFYKHAYRIIGLVILLIGLSLIPLLPFFIRDYDTLKPMGINATLIFVLFLLQSVSSYLFFAYRASVMKANQKKYILDIADYAVTIITNIVQIIVLIFLKNFVIYTAVVIAFNIIKNFVNAIISKAYFPQFFEKEDDSLTKDEIVEILKDCSALFVYKLNGVILKATDNIVLSTFLGLTIVGVYSNYLLFYTTIKSLLVQVYAAVKASMGNLFAVEDTSTKYRFFQIMNFITFLIYGTAAVGVAVCANELIQVWIADDYVIPQPFAILIGLEILFLGLRTNLEQIRNISGAFRQMWFRPILSAFINLIVSILLVNICGIYGVIIGTLFATLLTNFLVDPFVIHRYSFDNYKPVSEYYKKNLLYLIILIFICACDIWLCGMIFVGKGWVSVLFHIIVVIITVPGVYVMIFYRTHECQYCIRLFKRLLFNR